MISLEKTPNAAQKQSELSVIETIVTIELLQLLEVKGTYAQRIVFVAQKSHFFVCEDVDGRQFGTRIGQHYWITKHFLRVLHSQRNAF